MEFAGSRIQLRPMVLSDLKLMVGWNRDQELQSFVDCDLPIDLHELERWYCSNVPSRNYQIFVIETLAGVVIGDLELDHISWSQREAELRIRIGNRGYWGKGYGGEAISLICDHLFAAKRFRRIYLRVYDFNARAIRCYLKTGFKPVGILQRRQNQWKNIILMELTADRFFQNRRDRQAG